MTGGGVKNDDRISINSTNVFATLGSLKKKKSSEVWVGCGMMRIINAITACFRLRCWGCGQLKDDKVAPPEVSSLCGISIGCLIL
ncbi:hypothetical protein Tco_1152581 [Tanacetum coccineum]